MKTTIHRANTRGHANHGWLEANHSFSFAGWFNPKRMGFGVLRVLNDDRIAGGAGFPTHPHDNMEIITIPLSGVLEHKDSMGNKAQIKTGEVQVMSAGTGITHSEYNASANEELKLFQIWIIPNKKNVDPRYEELKLEESARHNKLQQVVSPNKDDDGLWLYQNAWLNLSKLDQGKSIEYQLHGAGQGVYVMVVEGSVHIGEFELDKRDAVGIEETDAIEITAVTDAEILLIEVPVSSS
jgi:redox-sensitive bicupin YhaK (pirin superfamily)